MRRARIRVLLSASLAALFMLSAPILTASAEECGEEPCVDAVSQSVSYYYGDLDMSGGVPDPFDVSLYLRAFVGLRTSVVLDLTFADTNGDGERDLRDAAYILSSPDWTDAKQYAVVPGPPLR